VALALEALVQTTSQGESLPYNSINPASVVTVLCRQPRSVAEIAAMMSVPVGVVRVLIGDLLATGHVAVRETLTEKATLAQRQDLLERVLSGLQQL